MRCFHEVSTSFTSFISLIFLSKNNLIISSNICEIGFFFVKIVETKMKEFWWQNLACQIMFHYYQTAEDVRYVKKDLFWQTKTNPRKNVNFLEKVALWWKYNKKWAKKEVKLVNKFVRIRYSFYRENTPCAQ